MRLTQIFTIALLSIFLVSVVSATATLSVSQVTNPKLSSAGSITLSAAGNESVTGISVSSATSGMVNLGSYSATMANGTTQTVSVSLLNNAPLVFGSNNIVLNIVSANAGTAQATLSITKGLCQYGERGGNLSINDVSITNEIGGDDEEWMPLNRITVEVNIENNGDDDVDGVQLEMALIDSSGKNVFGKMDFISSEDDDAVDLGDIRDGDEETVTYEFVVPADFDKGTYKLAVKAYSEDFGENVECVDSASDFDGDIYQEIKISEEDDEGKFMAFDNIKIKPEEATCGDTVTLSADVYNVGDNDEDQVRINIESTDLKVKTSQEFKQGIDQGDKRAFSYVFSVPDGLKDKEYVLKLSADYDYKNGVYRESSDDTLDVKLKVFGCELAAPTPTPTTKIASINAELSSAAQAGKDVVITSTVKNLGSQRATFIISAKGYNSWATLKELSSRSITLDAGESEDVQVTLTASKDSAGEQSFTLEARSGDKSETREVSVDITKAATSIPSLGGNSMVWIIAIINVVLIILIIVVAVRIARK